VLAPTRSLTPVLRRRRAIELLFTCGAQRIIAAICGKVPVLWLITAVGAALHHWLGGRVSQIIAFIADVATVLIVKFAAALVRRTVRLAKGYNMELKARVAAAARDASLL
jgi:hypothetical protein